VTVGPALDATLLFIVDEDGSGLDHVALSVIETAGDSRDHAPPSGLKDKERIVGRGNETVKRGSNVLDFLVGHVAIKLLGSRGIKYGWITIER
jgi:hypothetical protein